MEPTDVKMLLDQFGRELENFKDRLFSIEKWKTEVSISNATIITKLDMQNEKIDILTKKVDALESKPAKRWDSVIAALISAAVGLVIGLVVKG